MEHLSERSTATVLMVASEHAGWTHIRQVLGEEPAMQVVGDVLSSDEALQLVMRHRPDLLLVDATITGSNSLSFVRNVRAVSPQTRVIVLGDDPSAAVALDLERVEIDGYLLWNTLRGDKALAGIRSVHAGHRVMSPAVATALGDSRAGRLAADDLELTDTEERVLMRLLRDKIGEEIAQDEAMGLRTVRRAIHDLKVKFQVRTLWGLTAKASRRLQG